MSETNPIAAVAAAHLPRVAGADTLSPLAGVSAFGEAVKMAKYLADSELIPAAFQGKPANIVIALELAHRIGASCMAVMQSLYIVHGKPGFSAAFLVATLNATRRFSPLRYALEGEGANRSCYCYAKDLDGGETVTGPRVSIAMAKAEGWYDRKGSKWKTMPDLMLSYRAATLFVRLFAPEISLGLRTDDELDDLSGAGAPGSVTIAATPEDFGVVPKGGGAGSAAPPASNVVVDEQGRTIDKSTGEVIEPAAGDGENGAAAAAAQEAAGSAEARERAADKAAAANAKPAAGEAADEGKAAPAAGAATGPEPPEGNDEGTEPIGDLSPGMQRTLLRKCHEARVTWKQVWKGIGGPITKASMNDALGWIDANAQA